MGTPNPLPAPTLPTGREVTIEDADGNVVLVVKSSDGELRLGVQDATLNAQLDGVLERLDRIIDLLEQRTS